MANISILSTAIPRHASEGSPRPSPCQVLSKIGLNLTEPRPRDRGTEAREHPGRLKQTASSAPGPSTSPLAGDAEKTSCCADLAGPRPRERGTEAREHPGRLKQTTSSDPGPSTSPPSRERRVDVALR